MAKKKEIVMTFWNGLVENVENIPKGQTVITRDVDEGGECEIYLRRYALRSAFRTHP